VLSMRERVGAFRVDWIRVEAWDIAIASIEGHRHRHSPSIGIRETGIDGLDGFGDARCGVGIFELQWTSALQITCK
jgi:hypothetical protein